MFILNPDLSYKFFNPTTFTGDHKYLPREVRLGLARFHSFANTCSNEIELPRSRANMVTYSIETVP